MAECSFVECGRPARTKGLCKGHRRQQVRYPDRPLMPFRPYNPAPCHCGKQSWRMKLCATHWAELPRPPKANKPSGWREFSVEQRIAAYMGEPNENGCIIWQGSFFPEGYGAINIGSQTRPAHRAAYAVANSLTVEDLDGKVLHHKCAVRACVNVDHLQIVLPHENVAEMHERNNYIRRIAELEAENSRLAARIADLESAIPATAS